jgi:hypothetical protein
MAKKKIPGEDGITGEMYKNTLDIFTKHITSVYSGCLRIGIFPKIWKTATVLPTVKPGKETSDEVSKY